MVVAVKIEVTGAKEIEARRRELGAQASNRIVRSALNRAGTPIVRRAKELAPQPGSSEDPFATGETKRALTKRLRRQRRGSSKQEILIGIARPTSRRAHFIESGTAHQPAEPFLRPALDEAHSQTLQIMQQALRDGIQREIKKLAAKRSAALATIGSLTLNIGAESATLLREIEKSNRAISGFARHAEAQTTLVTRGFRTAAAAAKGLASGVAAGLGVGTAAGIARIAKDALDAAGNLGELAAQAGVTVGQLQQLEVAALGVGVGQEKSPSSPVRDRACGRPTSRDAVANETGENLGP